jgi:hypothetical protein
MPAIELLQGIAEDQRALRTLTRQSEELGAIYDAQHLTQLRLAAAGIFSSGGDFPCPHALELMVSPKRESYSRWVLA